MAVLRFTGEDAGEITACLLVGTTAIARGEVIDYVMGTEGERGGATPVPTPRL